MPNCDPQQRQGGPFGIAAALLPVAQRVDADSKRIGESLLSQTNKSPNSHNVLTTRDASAKDTLALLAGNCPREVAFRQFTILNVHVSPFRNARRATVHSLSPCVRSRFAGSHLLAPRRRQPALLA